MSNYTSVPAREHNSNLPNEWIVGDDLEQLVSTERLTRQLGRKLSFRYSTETILR